MSEWVFTFFCEHISPTNHKSTIRIHILYNTSTNVFVIFSDRFKLISLNIPINYKLVVKLHPNMKGRNTIKFLKDLNKIFNVHVVNYSVLSNEILKNAECVITASGTTGLESLALGKKTVIIGHPSYGYLKSCFKINSFSELGNIMNTQDQKRFVLKSNRQAVADWLTLGVLKN